MSDWERIEWPDDSPLPEPGYRLELIRAGTRTEYEVVMAMPTSEPGRIEVQLRRPFAGRSSPDHRTGEMSGT